MALDNPIHIVFLLMLLLLVFGAKRLPELGRSLGTGMRGFKESLSGEGAQPELTPKEHSAPLAQSNVQETAVGPSVRAIDTAA